MLGRILKIIALALFCVLFGILVLNFLNIDVLAMLSLSKIITTNHLLLLLIFDAFLLALAFFIDFRNS